MSETITVPGSRLELKESMYYAYVPRVSSSGSSSNWTTIGVVSATGTWTSGAVSGITLDFSAPITSTFQSSGNITMGHIAILFPGPNVFYPASSGSLGFQSIIRDGESRVRLGNYVSGVTFINPIGNIFVVASNPSIDGDPVRGPYFIIDVSNGSEDPIEAYAFNVYFTRSRLHNELVTE